MTTTIKKIQKMVAVSEIARLNTDGTIDLGYFDVEWENDGRGCTAGCAGWTSDDEDLLNITNAYPPLSHWSNQLKSLDKHNSQFQSEWEAEAQKPAFQNIQDQVQETEYFKPAIDLAASYGLTSALAQATFSDAATQHGMNGDPDSLNVMAMRTKAALKLSGAEKYPDTYEEKFLLEFCDIRTSVLKNPSNHDTKDVWAESVGRSIELKRLVTAGNFDLVTPFIFNPWGDDPAFVIE